MGSIPAPPAQTSSPSLMDGPTLLPETGAGVPHAQQEVHSREGNPRKEDSVPSLLVAATFRFTQDEL